MRLEVSLFHVIPEMLVSHVSSVFHVAVTAGDKPNSSRLSLSASAEDCDKKARKAALSCSW